MTIRPLTTIAECRRVAALEREIWGYAGADEAMPPAVLLVSVWRGGILLGAFDEDDRLVGFVHSTPAVRDGRATQWSHALGVLPDRRAGGLGLRLKTAQREVALGRGIDLIEWTFDPLQAGNARFNFSRLGVVCSEYLTNAYGESSSPLHGGVATDRFVAEWHLARPHVERRLAARGQPLIRDHGLASAPVINPAVLRDGVLHPAAEVITDESRRLFVEIPADFAGILAADAGLAHAWREHTRDVFTAWLGRGYRVVDFFLSRSAGRGQYLLAAPDPA
jgi:predicted GNAT superfamily acetyltransferase